MVINVLIVYDSKTGNVQRFVKKLGLRALKVEEGLVVDEPFVLITYTTGFGQVPPSTENFLKKNHLHLVAVAVSGNRNWGGFYGKAGDIISQKYNVPLLMKFELSGTEKDVEKFLMGVDALVSSTKVDTT